MYLKLTLNTFLFICFSVLLNACDILSDSPCLKGKGSVKKETRDVTGFNGVDMRIAGKVFIMHGSVAKVTIETHENLLKEISTEVEGNSLVIRTDACLDYDDEKTTVTVFLPNIASAELKGSGNMRIQAVPSTQKLRLVSTGSGAIHYLGTTNQISVLHSGSGDITLDGLTGHLETSLSGSGNLQASFLLTDTAKVNSSGSGHQKIWVSKNLDATISGSGNIYYKGRPAKVYTNSTGTGKVIDSN